MSSEPSSELMLGVTGSTRLAGVIGDPVRHSLSPLVFNAAFAAAGLDLVYVALQVPAGEGAAAAEAMRTLGISGLSVTMPHKEDVISALDELSAAAQALGAVNCIVNTEGHLVGHNTDGAGFIAALGDVDFDPNGKSVLVLGAGGAARAVTLALVEAGAAAVGVFNRSPGRAELAASGAGDAASAVGPEALADFTASADLVVNATPVGMDPDDGSPLPIELIERHHLVADLIYHPAVTPLLAAADAAGATTINGEGMLLLQAAEAFRLMTGVEPPVGAMRKAMR